jgi:hypothetical protein
VAGKLDFVQGNCHQRLAVDFAFDVLFKACQPSDLGQVQLGIYFGIQLGLGKIRK